MTPHTAELVTVSHPRGALAASLCPNRGGELTGLTLRQGKTSVELLYRGNDFSPVDSGFPGRAPWLWPVAGRCYTDRDAARVDEPGFDRDACTWQCNGEARPMRHHGFAKDMAWRVESTDDDARGALSIASNGEHHDIYPFDFALRTEMHATVNGITLQWRVEADRANTRAMPFQLGLHLTFDFASWWGASWMSGTVHGLGDHAYDVNSAMQPNRRIGLPESASMDDARLANTIIPAGAEPSVRLVAPSEDKSLSIRFGAQPAFGDDDAVWVTHCDPEGRFFCCEPWVGWPNALNSGRGCVSLEPGAAWTWSLQLSLD